MGETDLISRQAAIEAIEQMQMPIMRSEFPEEQFVFTGMSEALQAIKDLPSVQPDRKKSEWLHEYLQTAVDFGIITEVQASRLMDMITEDNT